MSDIIRIENISSYIQEVIGDTLILKPNNFSAGIRNSSAFFASLAAAVAIACTFLSLADLIMFENLLIAGVGAFLLR